MSIEPRMARTADPITTLRFTTMTRYQVMDITSYVAALVTNASMAFGVCHLYVDHTTAAITFNENDDPNIGTDLLHGNNR